MDAVVAVFAVGLAEGRVGVVVLLPLGQGVLRIVRDGVVNDGDGCNDFGGGLGC